MVITLHFVSPLSYIQKIPLCVCGVGGGGGGGGGTKIQLFEKSTGGTCNSTGGKDPKARTSTCISTLCEQSKIYHPEP